MGLARSAPISWAWMEMGLEDRKKSGLANFCNPAKRNVIPRKRRRGSRYQPVAMVPSGPRTAHSDQWAGSSGAPRRAAAARARLEAFDVTDPIPCSGTIPVGRILPGSPRDGPPDGAPPPGRWLPLSPST